MRSLPRPMPLFLEADAALTGRNPTGSSGVTRAPTSFHVWALEGDGIMTETIRGQIFDCCCRWKLELHGWHGQHGKESIEDLPNQVWACRVPQVIRFCTQI
ncbi:hypothetical protein VPH35_116951 [Triticum aestivum]